MAKWLAREVDWVSLTYTGNYYDIAQAGVVSVFVDSYTGSDTNAGTAAAPFKTLSKAITTLNSTGANGSRIFMNGVFSENLPTQTYWYRFIGCGGGYNGKTVFAANLISGVRVQHSKENAIYENIITVNYAYTPFYATASISAYTCRAANCIFSKVNMFRTYFQIFVGINSIWYDCETYGHSNAAFGPYLRGVNNSYIDCRRLPTIVGAAWVLLEGVNQHFESLNDLNLATGGGIYNIWSVDGQYLDKSNHNFAVSTTSPLLFSGIPDGQTGIKSHVGAVLQGFQNTPASLAFTVAGGATLTNLEVFESKLRRVDNNQPAKLTSGYVYLGGTFPITKIDVHNVFDFDSLGVTKGVFASLTGSPRPALTIKIKYGNTTAEVDSCPWLEIEYGKKPTFSGTGANRKGNGDDTFDNTAESNINASILRVEAELKNR